MCVLELDLDVIGIAESHLKKEEILLVDGYTWFGQNRESLHVNAKDGLRRCRIFN